MQKCLICKNKTESIINFGDFPYSCGALKDIELEKKYNFNIGLCTNCGLIQQLVLPDPNILYSVTNHEGLGKKWENHYLESSKFIIKNLDGNNNNLLEIGGGSGKIIDNIHDSELVNQIIVTDFKYRGNNYDNLNVLDGLFEELNLTKYNNNIDLIYSSHVFEHISDFSLHLKKCKELLKSNGKLIILLPNFQHWIDKKYLNAFVQEHNIYPTKENIEYILNSNHFSINDIYYYEDHSIYISCEFNTDIKINNINSIFNDNLALLNNYKIYLENLTGYYNQILGNKKYYIFGAHIFAQILLFGGSLNIKNCKGILDNAKFKQGKFLYGTNLKVYNPDDFIPKLSQDDIIIVNAGAYTDEIKKQIKNLNNKVNII